MKVLVLLSGGVDSSTCLALAKEKYGDNVLALSMSYGQKHAKELAVAQAIADYYHVELLHMDLSKIFAHSKCSLLQGSETSVPHASYAEQLKESKGEPVSTYVPFRNGLFLSAAASIALEYECNEIYYGPHADDAAGNAYPDCSVEFNESMNLAVYLGSGRKVRLVAPFVDKTKKDIVAEGLRLGRADPAAARDHLLQTMACKSAIKAGMHTDPAELRRLVDRVQSGEIQYCPHGRPVAVKLSKYQVEKMFKRA